jgi:hypothetical protein
LTAWAAIFTGIYTNHHPRNQQSALNTHAGAIAGFLGCLVIWDIVLTYRRRFNVVDSTVVQAKSVDDEERQGKELKAIPSVSDSSRKE